MEHELVTSDDLSASTVRISSDSESSSHKSEEFEELQKLVESDGSDSRKSNDEDLPETVTVLKYKDTTTRVYLIGTAHFSKESIDDVIKVIRTVRPQFVVLELCSARTSVLSLDEETIMREAKTIDFAKIRSTIQANGVFNGIVYLLLLNMSVYITKEMGMAPGGEFRAAISEATKLGTCNVSLGDRPIQITMQRALAKLSWFQTFRLMWHLLTSNEPINKEAIEKCKRQDMIEQLLTELAGEFPGLKEVFVNERDVFLTYSLQKAAKHETLALAEEVTKSVGDHGVEPAKIVGVVGMGHVGGIKRLWDVDQEPYVAATLEIPPPSTASSIFRVSFRICKYATAATLVYLFVPGVKSSCNRVLDKIISKVGAL